MVAGMRSMWGMPFCKIILAFLYKNRHFAGFIQKAGPFFVAEKVQMPYFTEKYLKIMFYFGY